MYEIVRPFQRHTPQTTRRLVATNEKIEVEEARAIWGRAGNIAGAHEVEQVATGTAFEVLTCDDEYDEVSRKSDEKRVENPDDADQYVIVQRPYQIQFKKNEDQKNYDKRVTYTVAAPEGGVYLPSDYRNRRCQLKYNLDREDT